MFTGTGVALVTPFRRSQRREIDYPSLDRVTDRIIASGADYIVVMGSTGETPTLTAPEQAQLQAHIAAHVAGRIPLVLGLGGNDTAAVADRLAALSPYAGYSAVLSVTPFYNRPSQSGLEAHFRAVAEASPLPVILYNVPSRTGVNMLADTTLRLAADCRGIVAIKEASGNIAQIAAVINGRPDGFSVISGDDSLTLPLLALGADGVISVIANAFPRAFSSMVRAAREGDFVTARRLDTALRNFYPLLSVDGNPSGIKALMNSIGLIENELRLPLTPVSQATADKMAAALALPLADIDKNA